jgi:DNA invertase Pin-like site-specific DNA recombinase
MEIPGQLSAEINKLIDQLYRLGEAGVDFLSLRDRIDTTDKASHLFYYFIGQFRDFEEQKLLEHRIRAAAKKGPRKAIGRPPRISEAQWQEITRLMSADPPISAAQAAKLFGVSRQAIHSRLKREKCAGQRVGRHRVVHSQTRANPNDTRSR